MAIKEPQNDDQRKFFALLFENNGNVASAAEACGYARPYAYTLVKKYQDWINEQLSGKLTLGAIRASEVLINTLSADGKEIEAKLQFDAAKDILDRAGLGKQDRLKIHVESENGIFLLPAKDIPADD